MVMQAKVSGLKRNQARATWLHYHCLPVRGPEQCPCVWHPVLSAPWERRASTPFALHGAVHQRPPRGHLRFPPHTRSTLLRYPLQT